VPVDIASLTRWQWLKTALDLEETGKRIEYIAMASLLRVSRVDAHFMLAHLCDNHLINGGRVSGRGRWALQIPTLCYFAVSLDPMDPHASAAAAVALATDITSAIGVPLVAMMPSTLVLAKAAEGDETALDALVGFSQRADVVLVIDDDPLLEQRFDVVAAQRADVMVTVARPGEDPRATLHGALTLDAFDAADFWRRARMERLPRKHPDTARRHQR
jgi:hypothetical protein